MGMKQFHWNHIDQMGKIHKVGLLHGARTGHVLIHVNGKITSIDFKVLDSKQYSFFINEELIELQIIKHKDHYEYTMEINEEVKTPLNKKRKKERKKMGFQTLAFSAALILAIIGGTVWMLNSEWYKNKNNPSYELLATEGVFTKGKLFEHDEYSYAYHYVANNRPISKIAPSNNYTVEDGDEYMVRYLPQNPDVSEVHFVLPTERQLLHAMQKSVNTCMMNDETISEKLCICMAETAYDVRGYGGLITLINRNIPVVENGQFNKDTYEQLVNGALFNSKLSANCAK